MSLWLILYCDCRSFHGFKEKYRCLRELGVRVLFFFFLYLILFEYHLFIPLTSYWVFSNIFCSIIPLITNISYRRHTNMPRVRILGVSYCGCNVLKGEYALIKWTGVEKKMLESPSSLGIGTIYITPLRGRTSLTIRVWVWSLGIRMGRC